MGGYNVDSVIGDEFVARASELTVVDCAAQVMENYSKEYVVYIHSDVTGLKWPPQIWINKGQGKAMLMYVNDLVSSGKLPSALYREVGK